VYAVDLPNGGAANLNLTGYSGAFSVRWFNPREGGELHIGTVGSISGSTVQSIGLPPTQHSSHWVALVRKGLPSQPAAAMAVQTMSLINAETGAPVPGFESLADGAVLNLWQLPRTLNIRANTNPTSVGSVSFRLNENLIHRVESTAPYALMGDTNGAYTAWRPSPGAYTIAATPYSGTSRTGTAGSILTIRITIK
jgi:Putative collagen-binding domain of a collagenase